MGLPGDLTLSDLVLLLVGGGAFVLGFFQGTLRQLLALGGWFISFVVAANLKAPLGDWMGGYWTNVRPDYTETVAFLALFVVLLVTSAVAIQIGYRRVPLTARFSILDDLLGGLLAAALTVLVVASLIVILRPVTAPAPAGPNEIGLFRDLGGALADSRIGARLRDDLVPGLLSLLGPLVPGSLRG